MPKSRTTRTQNDSPSTDEIYGLEPVFEPGDGGGASAASLQTRTVQCPYCGERLETLIDLSCGSTCYIEDCQVCCRPIELTLEVDGEGRLGSLEARRSD